MAHPVVGFRVSERWYKDFADYMSANGVDKRELFEALLTILFTEMSKPENLPLPVIEKYRAAMNNLKSK